MQKMKASDILLVGCKGLGVEIAKNIVLAGIKSLFIYDPSKVVPADLSSQFFLHPDDIGKPTDSATCMRIQDLNPYVPVSVFPGPLDESTLARFQVVVVAGHLLSSQLNINDITSKIGIKSIFADTRGLFGYAFNDFGNSFHVSDPTGEEPLSGMISAVTVENDAVVTCYEENRHGLQDGDYVTFVEIQGMTQLNNIEPRKVVVTGPFTFKIGDTSTFSSYQSGGYFKQVKMGKVLNFKNMRESLAEPNCLISDFAKLDRPLQLHLCFQALDKFSSTHGRLPAPRNESDAVKFLEIVKNLNHSKIDLTESLIKEFAFQAQGDLPPMNAVIGGFVAQEVLKSCSGKFMPLEQYLYFDSLESLPKNSNLSEALCTPRNGNSRYDRQIAVYGSEFHSKIANSRQFLVGAGAISCEMLKNWAMMGLGTGTNGYIKVTDFDTIEKSNLNRQFLFRSKDVGKLKSECASVAVQQMNGDLTGKIHHFCDRAGPETENVFNEDFWENLTGVTNALDNVQARQYIDRRCVFFSKPLLESGTLGTKANVQVVSPHLTESYSSSNDPPEKTTPMCTLHNFPNQIEHTIQWAREKFESLFKLPADNVNAFLSQANFVDGLLKQGGNHIDTLKNIQQYLVTSKPVKFDDCIVWSRHLYQELFVNNIEQMLYNFPKDAVTSSGAPFWSGPKRAPTVNAFDMNDSLHMSFIVTAANLYAFNFGLKGETNEDYFKKILPGISVPKFTPKQGVKIAVKENELNQQLNEPGDEIDAIVRSLPAPSSFAGMRLNPCEFEKDDDTNYHIDFITATSNLRAKNYSIDVADRHKTKFIAGRIIPAIATTTALVAGLVCLELYKVIDERKVIDDYKNGFINLAGPFFGFSEPVKAAEFKYYDNKWTLWDRFEIRGDVTLKELITTFQNDHRLEITMLSCGATMLYSNFMPAAKLNERMQTKISKIVEQITKKPIAPHTKSLVLEMLVNDDSGEDVEVPYLRLIIK